MSLEHDTGRGTKARPGRKWPLLMRIAEVAFELGLSRRRIYQMIAAGELEVRKIGKASRVPSASVRKLAGETDVDTE
jgi:excisionase family DNA binding protein